jgi:hypothetical protein
VVAIAAWFQWLVAVALFVAILWIGLAFLRGVSAGAPSERIDPEDVSDLDVFFVCAECGTEFQVTRLGNVQVPRHCGEPMEVVRRARTHPSPGEAT